MADTKFETIEESQAWLVLVAGALADSGPGSSSRLDRASFAAAMADELLVMWRERRGGL